MQIAVVLFTSITFVVEKLPCASLTPRRQQHLVRAGQAEPQAGRLQAGALLLREAAGAARPLALPGGGGAGRPHHSLQTLPRQRGTGRGVHQGAKRHLGRLSHTVRLPAAGPDRGHDVLPLLHQQPAAEQPGQRVHQLPPALHLLGLVVRSVAGRPFAWLFVCLFLWIKRTNPTSAPTEVLPLVQFYLEEGVGDEEAVSLIDLEVPQTEQREVNWSDGDNARILLAGLCHTNPHPPLPPLVTLWGFSTVAMTATLT